MTERLHAAAAAQSDESRTLYYLPHMQVIARHWHRTSESHVASDSALRG